MATWKPKDKPITDVDAAPAAAEVPSVADKPKENNFRIVIRGSVGSGMPDHQYAIDHVKELVKSVHNLGFTNAVGTIDFF